MSKSTVSSIMIRKCFAALIPVFTAATAFAQMPVNGLDIKHYAFDIRLNDSSNLIHGKASITTGFIKPVSQLILDLVAERADGKGMSVTSVTVHGQPVTFKQVGEHLVINRHGKPGEEVTMVVDYHGVPADGLIISDNAFGDRTFFGDNWPNRAHNWIPCNDHLSDKATVDFIVTAPDHYQVVANGRKITEADLGGHLKRTHWKESVPLPTKVMVIGVTDFAVDYLPAVDGIPVSSWVYPQSRDSGFAHYAVASGILRWYIKHIGAYPFEKLANVQSTTIFGGMENAGCIFYFEKSVYSKSIESLMAHEIAHQWFGDEVTEMDWPHLWLSEGFATYMTDLYMESKYGEDSLKSLLKTQRSQVVRFDLAHDLPVVDTTESRHLMNLLDDNSYQKGAWVLHMLRRKVGDSLFWQAIRTYYRTYEGRNANTADLEKIFEATCHLHLQTFFRQWLYLPGVPVLKIDWRYNADRKAVLLTVQQQQPGLFNFPLQIRFSNGSRNLLATVDVKDKTVHRSISLPFAPEDMAVDPNVNLLFATQ